LEGVALDEVDLRDAVVEAAKTVKGQEMLSADIREALRAHTRWIRSDGREGARAELPGADLSDYDLTGFNLGAANLRGANLSG
ncbi:pentapeptide repeat-containing protein, partial [Salmonella enterica]|uniref:pentapeptide repeat-containing protein n=1 Tax=Salmonella enterica TaxID=28901 RepID=UPI003D274C48